MSVVNQLNIPDKYRNVKPRLEQFVNQIEALLRESFVDTFNEFDWTCQVSLCDSLSRQQREQYAEINNIYVGFASYVDIPSRRRFILAMKKRYADAFSGLKNNVIVVISATSAAKPDESAKSSEPEEESAISFQAVKPKYDLSKLITDDDTCRQIKRTLALVRNQKKIFDDWGFREVDPNTKTIVCFFGAPGTGKTMCAHAIASELNKNIMIASYASIESKWVGEGPKNMRKIFADAAAQDAILFFDEADSFLSKRVESAETGSDKHYNRMSNEMFQLLEDYNGVVIFATNLVTDFDKAFKSRILSFIEFKLPDEKTRALLIRTMIPARLPIAGGQLSDADLEQLAQASPGFSGREIRKALLASLSEAAMNSEDELTVDALMRGFNSVKKEREGIESQASEAASGSIMEDFLHENSVNNHILDVCLWAAWQDGSVAEDVIKVIGKISGALRKGVPDMTINYCIKNLDEAVKAIKQDGRGSETMQYVAAVLAASDYSDADIEKYLTLLCEQLGLANCVVDFVALVNAVKKVSAADILR